MNEDRFLYRVWDERNGRYGLPIYTYNMKDGIYRIAPPASMDGNFSIEQCSGKRDARDRLIFEADILYGLNEHGEPTIYCVWWWEGNMALCDSRGFVKKIQWRGEDFEIIGNAHFDPPREN